MQQFQQIVIIGMGLMGGSLALALKNNGYKGKIIGCDLSKATLVEAKGMGIIDEYHIKPGDAVLKADLIVLAIPVGGYINIFQEIGPYLAKDVIVTDLGSVKMEVERVAATFLPQGVQFLGGHPMAGSEKGGIKAATPFLFENAYYFLTPNKKTSRTSIRRVEKLVKNIGAYPVIMEANQHDKIVARISHLPHLTAVLLTSVLGRNNNISYLPFVGGGFRDSTRIASGNPQMWKDIFFSNQMEILKGIEIFEKLLQDFKEKLINEEDQLIFAILEEAKKLRDRMPHTGRDYIPPIYDLIIDAQDRPGVLGELTQIIGDKGINIKEIEILHARQGVKGAIRVGFATKEEEEKAFYLLKNGDFPLTYRKGVD